MNQEKKIVKIIELMQRDNSVNAPEDSVKWVKNLCLTRERKSSLIQRLVAVLRSDLLPNLAVPGERSAASAKTRQMFFQAGDNGVDLRITSSKKRYGIKGQVLGLGFKNALVKLTGVVATYDTRTDGTSMFEIGNVHSGEYILTVTGEEAEVVIESIEL